jgi:hypothetical protein
LVLGAAAKAEAGGGPRKAPPELYVSSEEERLRVQGQVSGMHVLESISCRRDSSDFHKGVLGLGWALFV